MKRFTGKYAAGNSAEEVFKKMGITIDLKVELFHGEGFSAGAEIVKYFFTKPDGKKDRLIEVCTFSGPESDFSFYQGKSRFGEIRAILESGIYKSILKKEWSTISSKLEPK